MRALFLSLLVCLGVASTAGAQPGPELAAKAQQGQAALNAGRFDEAARLYAELVEAVPWEAGLRLNLGMALSMAGRPKEALPHLQVAADSGRSELFPAHLFLGAVNLELGRPRQAVTPLQAFLKVQPDNPQARQMLAEALMGSERYVEAVPQYRKLTEQGPEVPQAWFGLVRAYEGVSEEAFQDLQTDHPESVEILLLVAEALVAQERDKRAFTLYREALEKRPGNADAHEAVAAIYERDGHPEWAASEHAKAQALSAPDCAAVPLECAFREGRYGDVLRDAAALETAAGRYWLARASGELAREAFARLETLQPSPEGALIQVQILRSQRRYSESIATLKKAQVSWPEDLRIRRELATLHFMAQEYAEAEPLLEDLLSKEPDSAELNLLLGELWVEQRKPDKGVPYLEKAVAAEPERLRARAVLGRAYLDAGEAAKAIPHLEAALPTDEDGSLRFQLARAYQGAGQAEQARAMRQEFQEIQRASRQEEDDELVITPP